jgi:hypothetical protein
VAENDLFDVSKRDAARSRILEIARRDSRVVSGAVVGSFALTEGDRWSDLDLTFAVADDIALTEVLDDWATILRAEFDGVVLFDLPSGPSVYRVFLLPGALQVDLSVTPASEFRARGETFRLLFGETQNAVPVHIRPSTEVFGHAVHHALHARVSIERDHPLQAEYWISLLRDETLALASARLGLPTSQARGAHELPREVVVRLTDALVRSLDADELTRALGAAVKALLAERGQAATLAAAVEPQLLALAHPAPSSP